MSFAGAMAVAMAVEALVGWPAWLFGRIGHPVTWLGRLIDRLDVHWNRSSGAPSARRANGIAAALLVIALTLILGWLVQMALPEGWSRLPLLGILAWPFLALRSLHEHVAAVAKPLQAGDVMAARKAVSRIVGRDPDELDGGGIARAAIESLAENASDGIVAPVFWGMLLGLPGIAAYKAVNTLDSMIGHHTERHEDFGWAAARIDDAANFIPARLTGLLFAFVSARPQRALSCMFSDSRKHRSINAGAPEAAMAGSLGVRLCGPRSYHGDLADEPWLNAAARDPGASDIQLGLRLYVRAMLLLAAILVILALVL